MEKFVVTLGGIGLIAAIYWFFFGKKEEVAKLKNTWNIVVEGGYKPSNIVVPTGKSSTITFTRKDPNNCLEDVIIEDFKIKKFLPLNTPVTIIISPTKPGIYGIHCGMNMFHGRITVV